MNHEKLRRITMTALFAALVYIATNLIRIPTPVTNGYTNLGDCVILLGAFLLDPISAAAAAGIGSALGDLLAGYLIFAPGTLVIKAAMGLCAALLRRSAKRYAGLGRLLGGISAELLMVAGYFAYEWVVLSPAAAAAALPGNAVQGAVGIALSLVLYRALIHIPALRRFAL